MFMKVLMSIWHFIARIFNPNYGLVPATIELRRAMDEARRKYQKTGHRFFCIWDPGQKRLFSVTYDGYAMRGDSYAHLRRHGKFLPLTREQIKKGAFFYTASRNGAQEMPEDEVMKRLEVLRRKYYAS